MNLFKTISHHLKVGWRKVREIFKTTKKPFKTLSHRLKIGSKKVKDMVNKAFNIESGPHDQTTVQKQIAGMLQDSSMTRGIKRGGGQLGDETLFAIIPQDGEIIKKMKDDTNFRIRCITELNNFYESVRNFLYRKIGEPNPSRKDPDGIVPRDTGSLRRSIRWSLSRNYTIIPDVTTKASDVILVMWIFAKKKYARDVTRMSRIKGWCKGPAAVAHPFNLPKCKGLDRSRNTGRIKYDPSAQPNFFRILISEGRSYARRRFGQSTLLSQNFTFDTSRNIKI